MYELRVVILLASVNEERCYFCNPGSSRSAEWVLWILA